MSARHSEGHICYRLAGSCAPLSLGTPGGLTEASFLLGAPAELTHLVTSQEMATGSALCGSLEQEALNSL